MPQPDSGGDQAVVARVARKWVTRSFSPPQVLGIVFAVVSFGISVAFWVFTQDAESDIVDGLIEGVEEVEENKASVTYSERTRARQDTWIARQEQLEQQMISDMRALEIRMRDEKEQLVEGMTVLRVTICELRIKQDPTASCN